MKNLFLLKPLENSSHVDSLEANALFEKFFNFGFDYQEAAKYGDYFSLANADVFVAFLPDLIDGFKKNLDDFIIYPILSALNPDNPSGGSNIAFEIQSKCSEKTRAAILELLDVVEANLPIPQEELVSIARFWRGNKN